MVCSVCGFCWFDFVCVLSVLPGEVGCSLDVDLPVLVGWWGVDAACCLYYVFGLLGFGGGRLVLVVVWWFWGWLVSVWWIGGFRRCVGFWLMVLVSYCVLV